MLKLNLGERIKYARESAKLFQEDLAEMVGLARLSIVNYEKNTTKPKTSTLIKIADVCKVSDIWLINGNDENGIFLPKNDNLIKENNAEYFNSNKALITLVNELDNLRKEITKLKHDNDELKEENEQLRRGLSVQSSAIGKMDTHNKKLKG